jgi:hypothetical protein
MQKLKAQDKAVADVVANAKDNEGMEIGGIWEFNCYDADGNFKWSEKVHNLVTNEGLNHILDVEFHAASQVTTWYVGLKGTGDPAAGDTLASHAGWTEFADYSGNRQEFVEGAASSQAISNSGNAASFTMTGGGTVAGSFLTSAETGTSGTLFSAVNFTASRTVATSDVINVTYTLSIANGS